VNVGEAFLNNPKDDCFQVAREPREVLANIEIDHDLAALRKTLDVPPECRRKTGFIQERRMQ